MSGWTGFTDEELRRLKNQESSEHKTSKINQKKAQTVKEKKLSRKIAPQVKNVNKETVEDVASESVEQKGTETMSSDDQQVIEKQVLQERTSADPLLSQEIRTAELSVDKTPRQKEENFKDIDSTISKNDTSEEDMVDKVLVHTDYQKREMEQVTLEKIQKQQKIIEEQNKKKQKLIQETLQQRFKETQTEAEKLKSVQKELQKLDKILQTDVDVLRSKIEEASLQYSQAQKRFQTAEKEYVEAKLDYFKKKEIKDQLTEHLCSIIQQNEMRKSKKLEEILSKLAFLKERGSTSSIESQET